MFNFLLPKEEEIVKIAYGSTCEIISTGTVNVIKRDEAVRALEEVQYVSKTRYNLISIRVLDKEECQIQVQ